MTDAHWPLTVILLAALAACGDDGGEEIPLQQSGLRFAAVYCQRVFECCTAGEIPGRFPGATPEVTDEASCAEYVAPVFGNEFISDTQRAETAGRATYLGDRMAACLDHMRGESCAEFTRFLALPKDCESPTEPGVEIAGACDHNFHCKSGYCEGAVAPNDGTCQPLPELGQPCPDRTCAEGLRCDGSAGPEGLCELLGADGADCMSGFACQSGACNAGSCGPRQECTGP